MRNPTSIFIAAAMLCFGWLTATPVCAADDIHIKDNGSFFSAQARAKADAEIAQIKAKYNKEYVIETYASIPDDLKAQFDQAKSENKVSEFYADWVQKRGHDLQVNGIVLIVCQDPKHLELKTGMATQKRAFTREDQDQLTAMLIDNFKNKKYDEGLLGSVKFVHDTMAKNLGESPAPAAGASGEWFPSAGSTPGTPTPSSGGGVNTSVSPTGIPSWFKIILGIIALFFFLRIIGSLFRGSSGGYGGGFSPGAPGVYGQGYGPGYGGGYQGGGGGFMRGMFGGLLGGAAGSYLYDRFGRPTGGTNYNPGQQNIPDAPATGGDFGAPPDQFNQNSGGASGGDFGGGASGGDFGGGGGGGGDFGGGGGGDSGGATGGDF